MKLILPLTWSRFSYTLNAILQPRKIPIKARSSHKEAISPAVSRTLRFTIDNNE